jgi:predicted Zn-dependent protease
VSKVASLLRVANQMRGQGNLSNAERLYRQALAESPAHAPAARALAELLLDSQRAPEALAVLQPAIAARPYDAALRIVLGRALFLTNLVGAAEQSLTIARQVDPGSSDAALWLAWCRIAAGRPGEAESLLVPLLAARGGDVLVRRALGVACIAAGKPAKAVEHFRVGARLAPGVAAHADLACALYEARQLDESIVEFDAALAIDPGLPRALGGKALILADRGEHDEARRLLRIALDGGSLIRVVAATYARVAKTPEHRADARRVLQSAIARPEQSPADRSALLNALGVLEEREGRYDEAFESFRGANELIPSGFSEERVQRSVAGAVRVFGREAIGRLPRSTIQDPLPVFIVGMVRSGTSLVEQILASHPAVHGAGELDDVAMLTHSIPALTGGQPYPDCIPALTRAHVDQLASAHLARLRALGGSAERVTDKMPPNWSYLGVIDLLFPGARIVHCLRDPLDNCLSCYTTPLISHSYHSRLRDIAAVYRSYRTLMDHWRSVLRVPILEVRYEDLVAHPEERSRELVEFLGLPWDPACLRFHENERVVGTASNDQVRRPVYASSVGRWKHYERHLGELIEGLRDYL